MPTFQPKKFSSGFKRKRAVDEITDGNDIAGDDNAGVLPYSPPPPPSSTAAKSASFSTIRTPSAILSRDPTQLSAALGASIANVKDMRANVAEGIISNPFAGHGRHAAEVAAEVTRYCIEEGFASHIRDGYDGGNDGRAGMEREDNDNAALLRPPPLMAGAMTALDMCAKAITLKNICSRRNGNDQGDSTKDRIRTGSRAVDQLLAPNSAYSSFCDALSLPYPYSIPAQDDSHSFDNSQQSSPSSGGIPFGMVTEFSGPTSSGKTQLALSIAAHAAFENKLQVHYISGGNSRRALSRRLFTIILELARSSAAATADNGDMQSHGGAMTNRMEEEAKFVASKALDRVSVTSVPDGYSLLAALARIDNEEASIGGNGIQRSALNESMNGTLLIIDSVSGCLGHHLSTDAGAALANQVALTLRQMARTHDGRLQSSTPNLDEETYNMPIQPRRFAAVVTNGSVAKRSLENETPGSNKTITGKLTQNKPAMGRYWHVSDVGIWLEEDSCQNDDISSQSINFYNDTSVVGLSLVEKKVASATLQNHYGKSSKRQFSIGQHSSDNTLGCKPFAKFRIQTGGIDDV